MEQFFIIWCGAMFFLRQISRKVPRNFYFPWCFFPKVPRNLRLLRWVCPKTGCMPPVFPASVAVPWVVSVRFREAGTPFLRGFPHQVLGKFRKKSPNTVHPVPFFVPAAATFGGKCCFYPSEWWHSYPKKSKKKGNFWRKNVFVLLLQPLSGVYHPFLPGGAEIIPLYLNRVMPA